ncbi:MAG: indole-3-glycerol-phosphate synthase [Coriobacteriia bacterium]|nr:indole-3-glycerol-phosphate synthase [Coriobacteriia bacterium]
MNFLDTVVERRKARLKAEFGSLTQGELERRLRPERAHRPFENVEIVRSLDDVCVIAEVKKASPSAGAIAPDCVAAEQAMRYRRGGACAISVLTEPEYFGGSFADLEAVAAVTELPLLCKDFVVDPVQLYIAQASGADGVLLMTSVLGSDLGRYMDLARSIGIGPLVEVIDLDELDMACGLGARAVAVNARDLRTLEVDTAHQMRVLEEAAGCDVVVVAASGIRTRADVEAAAAAGADAVLVGETLMRAPIPEDVLADLTGVRKGARQ